MPASKIKKEEKHKSLNFTIWLRRLLQICAIKNSKDSLAKATRNKQTGRGTGKGNSDFTRKVAKKQCR